MYCVLCTVYCVLCTVYCVLCTVYCVLCTVYCVLCTVSHLKGFCSTKVADFFFSSPRPSAEISKSAVSGCFTGPNPHRSQKTLFLPDFARFHPISPGFHRGWGHPIVPCPYDTAIQRPVYVRGFAPFQLHLCCCHTASEGGKFFFFLPKKREVTLKLPFKFFLRTALGPLPSCPRIFFPKKKKKKRQKKRAQSKT